jgi:hypothetical protein
MWMMVVACADCQAKNFVAAVLDDGDPAQAEIALRRLAEEPGDALELDDPPPTGGGPVTVDDVLELHAFLEEFDGDFRRLFTPF